MAFEDWGNDGEKTKHEKALAEDGARLFDDDHQVGYGNGLRVDISAFLQDTEHADKYLSKLDATERFVLLAYYRLKKSEKQLAELVGLNECRFNRFLENTTNKFTSIVGMGDRTNEDVDRVLVLNGLGWFQCRLPHPHKGASNAGKTHERKRIRTSEVLTSYQSTKSWIKTGEQLGCYYVDLRRGIEDATEELKKKPGLDCELIASYMISFTLFSDTKDGAYAGRMGKLMGTTVRVKDLTPKSPIDLALLADGIEDWLFTPRALAAQKQSGD
ncbi:MAG: hypothetical protein WBE55_09340 [Candidatus Sulfotelmatobacter sp.]